MSKKRGRLPVVRPTEVIRLLERNGFRLLRSTKHLHYADNATPPHVVTVPFHRKPLKRGTLLSIVRQAGWTVEEFMGKL